MTEAGQAVVDAAKANGSRTSLDDFEDIVVRDDSAAAFDLAVTIHSRMPRRTARMAAHGERANQWPRS